jgi:RND family efflux transporter MFP subunit
MKRVGWLLAVVVMGAAGGGAWTFAQDKDAGAAAALAGAVQEKNSADRVQPALTAPNKEYQISFPSMGVIKEVRVKEGEPIKKDDVLMVQDTTEEVAELKMLEIDATNTAPIEAAKAKVLVAEVEFKAKDNLKKDGGFVELEWERAKAQLEVAKHDVTQAERELEMKKARRDKQDVHVKRMELRAPTDGVVLKLETDLGANVDPTKPSIVVVENNPLRVIVQVPALASLQMKKGDKMRVSYDRKNWKEATISSLSPKADAQSGWREIYLELPNPEGDPSGLQAFVELPESAVAAVDRK